MAETKIRAKETFGLERKCPVCGSTSVVRDYQQNTVICKKCGRIIEEDIKDRGPEWRAFSQEEREEKMRAGPPSTEAIHDRGLSTQIDWRNRDGRGKSLSPKRRSQMYRLRKLHKRARLSASKDRNLATAFSELNRMCSQLGLPESLKERTAAVYREAVQKDLIRGRSIEGVVSAVLYAECMEAGIPRTPEEIAEVSRVDKEEIGQTFRFIAKELDLSPELADSASYVARFGSELEISGEARAKAIDIIKEAQKRGLTVGMSPAGIAAAAIYIACSKTGEPRAQEEVAKVAGVTEVTVRNRYKEISRMLRSETPKAAPKEKVRIPKPDEVQTKVENVVASVNFKGTKFDLEKLTNVLEGSEYDPDRFPGVTYHLKEPKASFLIFSSGKANCVGAESLEGMRAAVEKLTSKLRRGGFEVPEPEVETKNVVVQVKFGLELNLDDLHRLPKRTSYDPETFPGLHIELEKVDGDFLLFRSGAGVCHVRNIENLDKAVEEMIEILHLLVKQDSRMND